MTRDPASFRDPAGQVFEVGGRILRTVSPAAMADYAFARDSGALAALRAEGLVIAADEVDGVCLGGAAPEGGVVLEHPRLPFWSYPYEWSFGALQAAALAHLDIQMRLLEAGVALSDASAYNVQFRGAKPVFVDALSFRRYRAGEHWAGYRQFCEQFLVPLLLRAELGVPFQEWYRGRPEGIPAASLARLLGWRRWLSLRLLLHVALPARLQARLQARHGDVVLERAVRAKARGLPLASYRGLLGQLRAWVVGLRPKGLERTPWTGYGAAAAVAESKRALVGEFVRAAPPALLMDLGCNTGDYAAAALEAGAGEVVGLDADHGALEAAFARSCRGGLSFLPLYQDGADPSPGQGWQGGERRALAGRCGAVDAVMALAFVHHLAIGRNVPLAEVVGWIVSLAPRGLIEFVCKDDPAVRRMLALRGDVFEDYSREAFAAALGRCARVVAERVVSETGRVVFWFERGAGR